MILFDVDGTLVDTAGAGRRAMEQAFAEVFGVEEIADRATVPFAGMTDGGIIDALMQAVGLGPAWPQGRQALHHRRALVAAQETRQVEGVTSIAESSIVADIWGSKWSNLIDRLRPMSQYFC